MKNSPKPNPRLRFIVNRINTVKWDQLPVETLIEWVTNEPQEVQTKLAEWINSARHGLVFVLGENRIVAIDLD